MVLIVFTKVIIAKSLVVIIFLKVLYSSLGARKSFLCADKGGTETDIKGTDYFTILSANIITTLGFFLNYISLYFFRLVKTPTEGGITNSEKLIKKTEQHEQQIIIFAT
jgi:hypothetical protein